MSPLQQISAGLELDHDAAATAMAALRKAQAEHPALQGRRIPRNADYGPYTGHPMDPRTDDLDDETMTREDAEYEATEQLLSYAESVADWLAKACDTDAGRQPLDVRALEPLQIIEGDPALLLTVLMNGDQLQAMRALHRLRELAAAAFKREITERADELMREAA